MNFVALMDATFSNRGFFAVILVDARAAKITPSEAIERLKVKAT